MQFFSSNKRLQEIFFENHPPPAFQELNGRPPSALYAENLNTQANVNLHAYCYCLVLAEIEMNISTFVKNINWSV